MALCIYAPCTFVVSCALGLGSSAVCARGDGVLAWVWKCLFLVGQGWLYARMNVRLGSPLYMCDEMRVWVLFRFGRIRNEEQQTRK